MSQSEFTVKSIRKAPPGIKDGVAIVSFEYHPAGGIPELRMTRWSAEKKQAYPLASVIGASKVFVHDVPVVRGKSGPWVQTSSLDIPRHILDAVAIEAEKQAAALK